MSYKSSKEAVAKLLLQNLPPEIQKGPKMEDWELREKGPPLEVDNTILGNWVGCKRGTYWFLRGLDYKIVPAYFVFGRAFGAAVNVWHGLEGKGVAFRERLVASLAAARKIWLEESPVEGRSDTWENFKETMREYAEYYGEEEGWKVAYGGEGGEKGFLVPLPGAPEGVSYGGAIDALIVWKPYGTLLREDKTTGAWVNQGYMSQWDHASQVTGYIWGVGSIVGELPHGAYMNVAGKRARKDKSERFQRYLVQKTEDQIERFVAETARLVEELWKEWDCWTWDKTGNRNQINCTGGLGRSPCLYRFLCALDVDPWEEGGEFRFDEFSWREEWAPWERDGEG